MTIKLIPEFRFSHQGARKLDKNKIINHRAAKIDTFANRLYLSDGGAFLITGYRGVGKTTFINDSLDSLEQKLASYPDDEANPPQLLDVRLNIARPLSGVELMHSILRQLNKRLQELKLLSQLPKEIKESLYFSLLRTSAQLALKSNESAEASFGLKKLLSFNTKFTSAHSRDINYLSYDERSAENDLISITHKLSKGYVPTGILGLPRLFRRVKRLKLVFVFDELDKIDEANGNESSLSDILHSLKTLFTTSGISFIFVAGYSLHERWLKDVQRGDSVFESVFSESHYLPASWDQVDVICDPFIANMDKISEYTNNLYQDFKRFLAYTGRGIPRRILRGFYQKVHWDGQCATLKLDEKERRRIRFYAQIYQILVESEEIILGEYARELRPDVLDKQRLGIYYILDWILARGCTPFSLTELIDIAAKELKSGIAVTKEMAPQIVGALVKLLQQRDYLEEILPSEDDTVIGTASANSLPIKYRLLNRRLIEMGLHRDSKVAPWAEDAEESEELPVLVNRYQLMHVVGEGASAKVYKALDRTLGRYVAVKMFHANFFSQESSLKERLLAEAKVQKKIEDSGVVALLDIQIDDEHAFIVMEYIEGVELKKLIPSKLGLSEQESLTIAKKLLNTLSVVHQQQVIWRDIKPSNILISNKGRVVIMDFGSAQTDQNMEAGPDTTRVGFTVGTPAYMSPEQIRGERLTPASDIFSLALVMFELLTGELPWNESDVVMLYHKWQNENLETTSAFCKVPELLKAALLKALQFEPQNRYQNARDFLADLPDQNQESDLSRLLSKAPSKLEDIDLQDSPTVIMDVPENDWSSSKEVAEPSNQGQSDERSTQTKISTAPNSVLKTGRSSKASEIDAPSKITIPRAYALLFFVEQDQKRCVGIFETPVTLGRDPESDIQLQDNASSRYHATISQENGQYIVEELNTSNGVLVNGKRVYQKQILSSGDIIAIGNTQLRFEPPTAIIQAKA